MPLSVALLLILVLTFGPILIADRVNMPTLSAIGYSVFIGVIYAFLGYAKSTEPFDPEKFVITPISGAFAGIVMAYYGLPYSEAITWLANAGVLSLIEFVGKALVRRFWK
jgi:ABC-type Mn2+/Zn2+ transport system permease subunit